MLCDHYGLVKWIFDVFTCAPEVIVDERVEESLYFWSLQRFDYSDNICVHIIMFFSLKGTYSVHFQVHIST